MARAKIVAELTIPTKNIRNFLMELKKQITRSIDNIKAPPTFCLNKKGKILKPPKNDHSSQLSDFVEIKYIKKLRQINMAHVESAS